MKEQKKMLGNTIYNLRKSKGMSQAELGDLLGVSNKAVSKWETDEANPEISLLGKIAEIFNITVDELLNEVILKEDLYKEVKIFGFKGKLYKDATRYEFISEKKTKKQKPYLHINVGKKLETIGAKAKGVIAIGNRASGIISLGFVSVGVLSIGLLSIGILAVGIISLAILATGCFSIGVAAVGTISIGVVSVGAISIGYISVGGISIGYHAYTSKEGIAIGKNIHILKKK